MTLEAVIEHQAPVNFSQADNYNKNIKAIQLLKNLERFNQTPTLAEIEILKSYVGWGGLASVFPNSHGEFANLAWKKRNEQLKELLTDDEYSKANASITDAFYTPNMIIQAMWQAVERLGVMGGIALEPSCGTGRFIYQNQKAENFKFIGVENDSLTARIAKQITKGQAYIFETGFEKLSMPVGFDLVIGNPPYGDFSLDFDNSGYSNTSIHNQFIMNTLNKLNYGGVGVFVVSRYVMDSSENYARYEFSKLAKLVSAIRLPSSAFKNEANTEVVTDILVFKRHESHEAESIKKAIANLTYRAPKWVDSLNKLTDQSGNLVSYNSYFENQDAVAGKLGIKSSQFGYTLDIIETGSLAEHLVNWVERLPIYEPKTYDENKTLALYDSFVAHLYINLSGKEIGVVDRDETGKLYRIIEQDSDYGILYKTQHLTPESVWSERYGLHFVDGYYENVPAVDEFGDKVYELDNQGLPTSRLVYERSYVDESEINARSKLGANRLKKLDDLISIRDLLVEQIDIESKDYADDLIEANRLKLKAAYDRFVKKHGFINNGSNSALISDLPDAGLLFSLEYDYKGPVKVFDGLTPSGKKKYKIQKPESAKESAILSKRVIYKSNLPDRANDIEHALILSMTQKGCVNLSYMAELCDTDEQTIIDELYTNAESPSIFYDHAAFQWQHKALYLSGNVGVKLKHAKYADDDIAVKALESVMPERISIDNIGINIGAKWLPVSIYESFVRFITDDANALVTYHPVANCYDIECRPSMAKESIYGTDKCSLSRVLDSLLNTTTIRITKTVIDPYTRKEKAVFDQEATELAVANADTVKNEFADWLFTQVDLLEQLEDVYNDKFNSFVVPKFDGSHLILTGKVPDEIIKLRQHQLNVIYRGLVTNVLLADHSVGSGKTFEIISICMMRKKLGLSTKPMAVIPNHLIEQFTADVYRLFPSARVLAASSKDFEKKKRKRLMSRIATGDYDLVIVPHSSFEFIKLSTEIQNKYIQDEIDIVQRAMLEHENINGSSRSAKTLAQSLKRLEKKLKSKINEDRDDKLIPFEKLGITHLAVDESDIFKNLSFISNMRDVVGLGNPSGSNRALDLYLKVKWIKSINGSVNYFTGTSISNSGVEMYLTMHSLIGETLDELGIGNLDNWANFFAENSTKFEASETGKLKQVTRFAREWKNMRTLMNLWYQFTDAITNDDIQRVYKEQTGEDFPIPPIIGGQRQSVIVEPNSEQEILLDEVLERYSNLDQIPDPMDRCAERLRLMDLAKKLSLAARCVDPIRFKDEKGGKLEAMADNIYSIYKQWDEYKGTQLVFFDRSVPRKKTDSAVIKKYDELRAKLDKAIENEDENLIQSLEDRIEKYNVAEIEAMRMAQLNPWNSYQELKDLLVERGMKTDEIRFVQEANNDKQKQELFDLVRSGEVRVLIGSTHLMGAGTNVQNLLVHLHHGDVTWRPRDLEQREGRIIRQGNQILNELGRDKFAVGITCYVTKYSMDAKLFEVNGAKLKMIKALRNYAGEHSIDFGADADSITLQEIAAVATGNPLMLERVELDVQIKDLQRLYNTHLRKQSSLALQVSRCEREVLNLPKRHTAYVSAKAIFDTQYLEAEERALEVGVDINGKQYTDLQQVKYVLNELKENKAVIKINGVVTSFTKSKDVIKNIFESKRLFSLLLDDGQLITSALRGGELVYARLPRSEEPKRLGDLFGLPVYVEYSYQNSSYYFTVLTEDGEYELCDSSVQVSRLTVMNISSALLSLVDRIITEFNRIPKMLVRVQEAKKTIDQIKPLLGVEFSKQAELDYKQKRLELVIKALQSDDSESEIVTLMEENQDEMKALKEKMAKAEKTKAIAKVGADEVSETETQIITTLAVNAETGTVTVADPEEPSVKEKIGKKNKPIVCKVVVNGRLVKATQMDLF